MGILRYYNSKNKRFSQIMEIYSKIFIITVEKNQFWYVQSEVFMIKYIISMKKFTERITFYKNVQEKSE